MIGIRYIVDTNTWIDYLNASFKGELDYKSIIELEDIIIPSIIVSELKRVYTNNKKIEHKFQEDFNKIKDLPNVKIIDKITINVAIQAGELRSKLGIILKKSIKKYNEIQGKQKRKTNHHISLIDCIIISMAIANKAKVLSKDIDLIILSNPKMYNVPVEYHSLKNYIEPIYTH